MQRHLNHFASDDYAVTLGSDAHRFLSIDTFVEKGDTKTSVMIWCHDGRHCMPMFYRRYDQLRDGITVAEQHQRVLDQLGYLIVDSEQFFKDVSLLDRVREFGKRLLMIRSTWQNKRDEKKLNA